jgi:hypothetical protein
MFTYAGDKVYIAGDKISKDTFMSLLILTMAMA